jgi:hypothetical protein
MEKKDAGCQPVAPVGGSQEAGRRSRGVEFAPDSPLEGGGFELSVPRQRLHGRDQFEPPDPHQEVASDSLLPSVKAPAVCRAYHQILRGQSSRHKKSGPS